MPAEAGAQSGIFSAVWSAWRAQNHRQGRHRRGGLPNGHLLQLCLHRATAAPPSVQSPPTQPTVAEAGGLLTPAILDTRPTAPALTRGPGQLPWLPHTPWPRPRPGLWWPVLSSAWGQGGEPPGCPPASVTLHTDKGVLLPPTPGKAAPAPGLTPPQALCTRPPRLLLPLLNCR